MNILTTTDYSIFKKYKGNRAIDHKHVYNLVESFKQGIMPFFIEVNSDFEVIDGQNRLEALKILNLPVNYVINTNQYNYTDIIRLNNIKKAWKIGDYANYWEKQIVDNSWCYEFYNEVKETFRFSDHILLAVIGGTSSTQNYSTGITKVFKNGKLQIENKNEIYNILIELKTMFENIEIDGDRSLAFAFLRIKKSKQFDYKHFINKIKQYKYLYEPKRNTNQYVDLLETIYNYKNHNKVSLKY